MLVKNTKDLPELFTKTIKKNGKKGLLKLFKDYLAVPDVPLYQKKLYSDI